LAPQSHSITLQALKARKSLAAELEDIQKKRAELRKEQQATRRQEQNAKRRKNTLVQAFDRLTNNELLLLMAARRLPEGLGDQAHGQDGADGGPMGSPNAQEQSPQGQDGLDGGLIGGPNAQEQPPQGQHDPDGDPIGGPNAQEQPPQ
jgi:hypothetical protein